MLREDPVRAMYVPYQQHLWDYSRSWLVSHAAKGFVIRTASNPMDLVPAVRGIVAELDSEVTVGEIGLMRERLLIEGANEQSLMRLLGAFAGLGRNPKPGTTGNMATTWFEGPTSFDLDVALSKSVQIR